MFWFAFAAVELIGNFAAELDLIAVLLAVKFCWVKLEVIIVVQAYVLVFVSTTGLKLLETQILRSSAHKILIEAVFCS